MRGAWFVGRLSGYRATISRFGALELSRHSEPGVLEELMDTLRSFSDTQALSRELVGQVPREIDWREHADGHTGALFAFCCRVGGKLAGAPAGPVVALGRYGRHLGRMWHIAEDIAALEHGEPSLHLVARAVGGRPVLPVILAAEADPSLAQAWTELAVHPDPKRARDLAPLVVRSGLGPSREALLRESWVARRALAPLADNRYRQAMDRFVGQLVRAFIPKVSG